MKMTHWLLALASLFASGAALAQEDGEDPFADEDRDDDDREDDRESREEDDHGGYIDDDEVRTFGRSGSVVISAERLLGFARTTQQVEVEGAPDIESDVTRTHLLQNAGGADYLGFSTPRLAFDLFVADGFSIGLASGYSSDSGGYDYRQFTVGGRVGYAHMFGKVVGVWGRAGVTYQDHEAEVPGPEAKLAILAATVDALIVVVPVKHVVLSLGPRLDLGIVGKLDAEGRDKVDVAATELGFSAGFGIFF